ncbi:MAG: RNA-dependent RNA polymerase [Erysiphe necator associated narnavirus 1]|nr:MAG: RNA-dependent RNA polymerase [Erysiphe necator associated narnavirus 1]
MVRFSHKCIPLTSNLREPKCKVAYSIEDPDDSVQWEEVLRALVRAVRNGTPEKETISWTYDHETLWSPRLVDTRGFKVNQFKCSQQTFVSLLATRTYWYKRLPASGRHRVRKLCLDNSGRLFLRDILNTVDGVLMSLIFSFPEMFLKEGYALSDRITSSIMMNCFHNYSNFQKKIKKVRKDVKKAMLSKVEIPIDDSLRDMSFLVRPLQCFNTMAKSSSKEKMFRVAMFVQTRATGLAGKEQVNESIESFLSAATQKREFKPNALLERCIDEVIDELLAKPYLGTNPEFKMSMSTSACRESSRANEGKFGYLKTLVRDAEVVIPPLKEGIPGTLGKWLWPEAAEKLLSGDSSVMEVNVAAVRENGKARVVTSGSFWKDVALQPFSHITLHLIKQLDNLRSGLKASRLGWRFIEKIVRQPNDRGGVNWIFDSKDPIYLYTSDWAKATDAPTPEMGWRVTGRLLEKAGLDQYSLDVVKRYWLGPKKLMLRGKCVGTLVNGIPMGDPLTKTNLSLAHPIADRYARYMLGCLSKEEGNGDDTAAISDNFLYGKYHLEAAVALGYEASPQDDVTTTDWGTYAEEWFHLPTSNINSTKWGNRFKNSLLLPYLDTPKIRVCIGTQKDRIDFSSDPTGKVTLLGHDQEYFKLSDPGPHHTIYSIASAFQDICLSTIDDHRPLFLPRQVNGVGKPPPQWSVESWLNIISRCRTWHAKYYIAAMKEFCEGTRGVTGYRGTLKESNHFSSETMVEIFEIPLDDPIRRLIVVPAEAHAEWPPGVLQKLVTLGYLVPESKLAKYYLFQERLENLEQDTKRDLFEVVKAKMINLPDIDSVEDNRKVVKRFVKEFRDYPFLLKGRREENLYAAAAIDGLEKGNPLTVPHSFPLIAKFCKRIRPSTPYEEDGLILYQWFMGAFKAKLKGWPIDAPPTDILEDDPVMIQKINAGGADVFLMVTDDIKLYRLALNKFPDTWIFRVSPLEYLQSNTWLIEQKGADADYDEELTELFQQEFGKENFTVEALIDKGSVESYLNKYFEAEGGIYWQTIGIPWRKSIKRSNMERKPRHGFINAPELKSFKDLRWPLSFMGRDTHLIFKQSLQTS